MAIRERVDRAALYMICFILFLFVYVAFPDACGGHNGWWSKTFCDPAITWNAIYSILTLGIFIVGIRTIAATKEENKIQRDHAKNLFINDQRPWLKLVVEANLPPKLSASGNSLELKISLRIQNIGKSMATKVVTNNTVPVHIGTVDLGHSFDRARNYAEREILHHGGITIFPGEERFIDVSAGLSMLDVHTNKEPFAEAHFTISVRYMSLFSNFVHETTRVYEAKIAGQRPVTIETLWYKEANSLPIEPTVIRSLGVFDRTT